MMSASPKVGDAAPDFTLPDGDGNQVSLHDLRGRAVVLYFYPKDDTPGCTKEACSFRDAYADLQAAGAQVLGVSADGVESHRAFAEKFNLTFPLLADEDRAVIQSYGVWREREVNGEKRMGITRVTFAIDEQGKIANVWEGMDTEAHGGEVLDWVRSRG
jgi:peroxiredoxin Q/BCP